MVPGRVGSVTISASRGVQNEIVASAGNLGRVGGKFGRDASKDFAEASKIFHRRVQGFRRGVQIISPTRPKYFADASKDFADGSRDFTADVVTLPTRPDTGEVMILVIIY